MEYLLSICCITYNHEQFINKAIDGFLMQKTTFPVEIIIGEDHSKDNTREIIKSYTYKYPDKIKLIISDQNVGAVENERRVILEAKGKYIAFCEGDDYWNEPYKLQKQVDFLESNPDYSVCFHRCKHVNIQTGTWSEDACGFLFSVPGQKGVEITTELFLHSWITQPLTMVFRRGLYDPNLDSQYKYYRDNHLIYNFLQKGKGYILSFEGGVYNCHKGSIHSGMETIKRNELTVNIARDLYSKNKNDHHLKNNLLRSLQYYITQHSHTSYKSIRIWGYIIEHFYYSLSLKQMIKNSIKVLKSLLVS